MMNNRHFFSRPAILLSGLLLLCTTGFAGGPLDICNSGTPYLWPNGGTNIPYNLDLGGLGPLNNADAAILVGDAFDAWEAIPTSTVTYTAGPPLAFDVDETNIIAVLNIPAPDGISPIIFDEDGAMFDLLFGVNSGVLGFAGPEWFNTVTCQPIEGISLLNGGSILGGFPLAEFFGVMVHEFGHYSGLSHIVVNGEVGILGDHSGPSPNNTVPLENLFERLETMYPFAVIGGGQATPAADDIATISTFYPEPGYLASVGRISGTIYAADGVTRISGANIIARNLADPYDDAVSAISGNFTESTSQADPNVGRFTLNGLTPGADYLIFADEILAGGFSSPLAIPFPGNEEAYNGGSESSDPTIDDPAAFTPVTATAGTTVTGIDIIFNGLAPGQVSLGDDDYVQLALPFGFNFCGETYNAIYLNSNGNITFGAPSTDFSETRAEMLSGPPRIAGLWVDLSPNSGGTVSFSQTNNRFTVRFEDVPAYPAVGANTFEIELKKGSSQATLRYENVSETFGIAGFSCGGADTSGFEIETDISDLLPSTLNGRNEVALFEEFQGDFDLAGQSAKINLPKQPFDDSFESNNSIANAAGISLPFNSVGARSDFTEISPSGGDVDFFEFSAVAGEIVAVEVVAGSLDTVLGLFDPVSEALLLADDDGGNGVLSRLLVQINVTGDYVVGVSTYPDVAFTGAGGAGGRYVLSVNRYQGTVLSAGDDTTTQVGLGFTFPFQGQNYSDVYVNSNGNLTFGAGDTAYLDSVPAFLNGAPRIAPLWDDLNAGGGLVIADNSAGDEMTIHFVSVPGFLSSAPNYFSVNLVDDGDITMNWGAVFSTSFITGVTAGAGATDPGSSDLSAAGGGSNSGTTYESFSSFGNGFDLYFDGIDFD